MSIVKTVKGILGIGSSVEIRTYECGNCDNTFDSAKHPERAECPECLSKDVSRAG